MDSVTIVLAIICISQTVALVAMIRYYSRTVIDIVSVEKAKNINEVIAARREFIFPEQVGEEETERFTSIEDIPTDL
jgi:hypothetical protein